MEDNALHEIPATGLSDKHTVLLCLPQVELEDNKERCSDERQNDGEASKAPTPANIVIEALGSLGACKSRDHVGRGRKSKSQSSMLQARRISRDDIDTVDHATKADCVEDLRGAVHS